MHPEIIKLLEENIRCTLQDIGTGKDSLEQTKTAQAVKAKINRLDHIKLEIFCTAKEIINKVKKQPREWGPGMVGRLDVATRLTSPLPPDTGRKKENVEMMVSPTYL